MKKVLLTVLLSMTLIGCTERTSYGECIGFDDDEDSTLVYEVSVKLSLISNL